MYVRVTRMEPTRRQTASHPLEALGDTGDMTPHHREKGRTLRKGNGVIVTELNLTCIRERRPGRPSARTADVGLHFGIPLHESRVLVIGGVRLPLCPGAIVLLTGPSGSGKSTLLAEIERQCAGGCVVDRVTFPRTASIVDRVAPGAPLREAVAIMTACALSEPRLWVRRFEELSDGEKFRARLARAVALHHGGGGTVPLLCDEFCSTLHRRAAKAISHNLRKIVARRNLLTVVACCQDDVIPDLQPQTIVHLRGGGRFTIERREVDTRRPVSLRRRLTIERGGKRDYAAFAAMHYRPTDELGFVDKVFVLRERAGGEAVGIVVYAHAPLELSLRNQATGGAFSRNPILLNRAMRILRRLVIHPDLRGCGLGHYLVRRTLPLVGTEYVECLAAMGEFNPVFARAGMRRIGQCALPRKREAALAELSALDVDPHGRDFTIHVCRRRRVREIISRVVYDWYAATTGGGRARVERQSPQTLARTFRSLIGSRPVYYLWRRRNPPGRKRHGAEQ